jgi:hypothetical protein
LIARHERLVVEEYFNGWSAEQPHSMQSVTKCDDSAHRPRGAIGSVEP